MAITDFSGSERIALQSGCLCMQVNTLLTFLNSTPQAGQTDAAATAALAARPRVLTVLCALCLAGADVAQRLISAGVQRGELVVMTCCIFSDIQTFIFPAINESEASLFTACNNWHDWFL